MVHGEDWSEEGWLWQEEACHPAQYYTATCSRRQDTCEREKHQPHVKVHEQVCDSFSPAINPYKLFQCDTDLTASPLFMEFQFIRAKPALAAREVGSATQPAKEQCEMQRAMRLAASAWDRNVSSTWKTGQLNKKQKK